MDKFSVLAIIAQLFFGSRMLLQWLGTEKAKKVVTPLTFWWLSLGGAFALFLYGFLRDDFPLILGQALAYSIYIRNLQIQKQWERLALWSKILIIGLPLGTLVFAGSRAGAFEALFSSPSNDTDWLFWLGISGQVLFALRYVYQWMYAERKKESVLPLGFWVMSLIGGLLSFTYFGLQRDIILIISYGLGSLIYARNIYFALRASTTD